MNQPKSIHCTVKSENPIFQTEQNFLSAKHFKICQGMFLLLAKNLKRVVQHQISLESKVKSNLNEKIPCAPSTQIKVFNIEFLQKKYYIMKYATKACAKNLRPKNFQTGYYPLKITYRFISIKLCLSKNFRLNLRHSIVSQNSS